MAEVLQDGGPSARVHRHRIGRGCRLRCADRRGRAVSGWEEVLREVVWHAWSVGPGGWPSRRANPSTVRPGRSPCGGGACGMLGNRGDGEGGTTAEPGDRAAQLAASTGRPSGSGRTSSATRRRRLPRRSTARSSGTSRSCGELGIPVQTNDDGNYRIPPGRVRPARAVLHPGGDRRARRWPGGCGRRRRWPAPVPGRCGRSRTPRQGDAAPHPGPPRKSPPPLCCSRGCAPPIRPSAPVYEAVRARRAVTLRLPQGGRGAGDRAAGLEPWGLVSFRGRWYVVGFDLDRGQRRTFRLSRIAGPVTAYGAAGAVQGPGRHQPARPGQGERLPAGQAPRRREHPQRSRCRAAPVRDGRARPSAPTDRPDPDPAGGWDDVEIPVAGLWDTARRIAGVGPDARVVSPPELRDAVRRILVGAAHRAEPGRAAADDQVEALWP